MTISECSQTIYSQNIKCQNILSMGAQIPPESPRKSDGMIENCCRHCITCLQLLVTFFLKKIITFCLDCQTKYSDQSTICTLDSDTDSRQGELDIANDRLILMQAEVHELRAVLKVLVSNVWMLDSAKKQGFGQLFPSSLHAIA